MKKMYYATYIPVFYKVICYSFVVFGIFSGINLKAMIGGVVSPAQEEIILYNKTTVFLAKQKEDYFHQLVRNKEWPRLELLLRILLIKRDNHPFLNSTDAEGCTLLSSLIKKRLNYKLITSLLDLSPSISIEERRAVSRVNADGSFIPCSTPILDFIEAIKEDYGKSTTPSLSLQQVQVLFQSMINLADPYVLHFNAFGYGLSADELIEELRKNSKYSDLYKILRAAFPKVNTIENTFSKNYLLQSLIDFNNIRWVYPDEPTQFS